MSKLNTKQELFIKEYLQCFNATESAMKAGYSKRTARSQGQRLLTNVDIKQKLDEEMKKLRERMAEDSNKAYAKLWKQLNELDEQIDNHLVAKDKMIEIRSELLEIEVEYGDTPPKEIPEDVGRDIRRLEGELKRVSLHVMKEHNWLKAQELRASLLHDIMDRGGYKATDKVQLDATVKVDPVKAIVAAAQRRKEQQRNE